MSRKLFKRAPPLRARAEAAAWVGGLSDPNRSSDLEVRFKQWLAESDANRSAWERQNDAWDLSGGLRSRFESNRADRETSGVPRQPRMLFAVAAVLSAALVAFLLAWLISLRSGAVATGTGEQRLTVLPDGSRVTLNTDTRILVQFDRQLRRVRLERGEALFDVRKAKDRPFVVVAGDREIRALGTAFEVRRDGQEELSVTLIEGTISVTEARHAEESRAAHASPSPDVTLLTSPGQRATFVIGGPPRLDRPALQQVIAWQSGEVVFNGTPLPEAAREMNRYSERQITVEGRRMTSLRVGGLFRAGDSTAFARAMAETFQLEMREEADRITLSDGK